MDNNTALVIMTIAAIIAGAALAIFAVRRPKEAAAAIDAIQANADRIAAVFALARDLAAGAEQMKDAGAIGKGDRLSNVIDHLLEIFPDISPSLARAAAEAGAYWINQIGRGAQLDRQAPAPTQPAPPQPQILPMAQAIVTTTTTTTTPPEPQP